MAGSADASVIRTRRMELVPMSVALVSAVIRGDWPRAESVLGTPFPVAWRDDGWQWLERQLANGEADERFLAWGTRLARPRRVGPDPADRPVLAEVGFHGPPDADGWVEISYRVISEQRRQGLAEEAVKELLVWAESHDIAGVKASVSEGNAASIGLLNKLEFVRIGTLQHPVLGELLSFRRARVTT